MSILDGALNTGSRGDYGGGIDGASSGAVTVQKTSRMLIVLLRSPWRLCAAGRAAGTLLHRDDPADRLAGSALPARLRPNEVYRDGGHASGFRGSGPSHFCPASAERRRIVAHVKSAPLFEKRAARGMPNCENLDRLGIYAVK
jgi:hypothetical protein